MILGRLTKDRRGGLSVLAALALVGMIGMGGLAVDLNRGYEQRIVNQRAADMAALAAATAYTAAKAESILQPTADDIVKLQGLAGATVRAELITGMPTAGAKAVRVTVTTPMDISLGRIVGAAPSFNIAASATASLVNQTTPACLVALAGSGNAIETSGGASINAANCAVSAVGSVANNGNSITAKLIVSGSGDVINNYGTISADQIRYAGNFTNPSWNNNVPGADKRTREATSVTDPLANNLALGSARELLGTWRAPKDLTNPTTPGGGQNWDFSWSPSNSVSGYRQGTSGNYIVPKGNYTIGKMDVAGGISVTFQPGSVVTVAKGVAIGGGSPVTFGDGTYRINGGFAGSTGVTFGNGELHIGGGTVSFAGNNRIGNGKVTIAAPLSLSGGTTMAIGEGDHNFGGITIGGGSWMTLGKGALDVTGQIRIDGDSNLIAGPGDTTLSNPGGRSIELSGSARFFMGDGLFSANGGISTQGGSRLVFGKTANHLVNGDMQIAGSVLFGAGRYTIKGNFNNGTGGTTWPFAPGSNAPFYGRSWGNSLEGISVSGYDMAGIDVTFILSGTINLGGGAKTKLYAPGTTTSGGALADILIDSLTSADTSWAAGSNNAFSGAIHLPNSAVTMSGGNSTTSDGRCFMLVASRIIASGGATAGTACAGIDVSGGGSNSVDLVL